MTSHSLESPRFTSFKQHVGTLSDPCSLHYRRRRPGRASPPAPLLCPPFLPPSPCCLPCPGFGLPHFPPLTLSPILFLFLFPSSPLCLFPSLSSLPSLRLASRSFFFLPSASCQDPAPPQASEGRCHALTFHSQAV